MFTPSFSLPDYLKRIGYQGEPRADLASVNQMMKHQLRSVPFENLDVLAGNTISIAPEDVVAKIIPTKRGGYCYEVNGLFAMALGALGIPYRLLGARPMFYPQKRWARTHMVILARIDDQDWLCDTGYGRFCIRKPLNLSLVDQPIRQDLDTYRLILNENSEYVVQVLYPSPEGDDWTNLYCFDLSPFELVDFIPANHYNATHPNSSFKQGLISVRHTQTGRIVLRDGQLKLAEAGVETVRPVNEAEADEALWEYFGLKRL